MRAECDLQGNSNIFFNGSEMNACSQPRHNLNWGFNCVCVVPPHIFQSILVCNENVDAMLHLVCPLCCKRHLRLTAVYGDGEKGFPMQWCPELQNFFTIRTTLAKAIQSILPREEWQYIYDRTRAFVISSQSSALVRLEDSSVDSQW